MSAQEEVVKFAQSMTAGLRKPGVTVSYRIKREDSAYGNRWIVNIDKESSNKIVPNKNSRNSPLALEECREKKTITVIFREKLYTRGSVTRDDSPSIDVLI